MQSFLLSTASQNEIAAYDNKVQHNVICIKILPADFHVFYVKLATTSIFSKQSEQIDIFGILSQRKFVYS